MKTTGLFLLACCFFLAANAQDSSYSINGNFTSVSTGKLYLVLSMDNRTTTDSTEVKNGRFLFSGLQSPAALAYLIRIKPGGTRDVLQFFTEPGKMTISGKGDSLSKLTINGSRLNEDNIELGKELETVLAWEARNARLYREAEQAKNPVVTDSLDKFDKPVMAEKRRIVSKFIVAHPASMISAYALAQNFGSGAEFEEIAPLFNVLTPELQNSAIGLKIQMMIEGYERVSIGKMLPEIKQTDTSGKIRSLSSLKGKYVLVDFWASWCGPCRAENPNVVAAYQRFHPRGFEIFGVSYDSEKSKNKWLKAINDDHLTWNHVSDLKGWENETSDQFNIKLIPANMLLDPSGKIIAKNLFGEELTVMLEKIFP